MILRKCSVAYLRGVVALCRNADSCQRTRSKAEAALPVAVAGEPAHHHAAVARGMNKHHDAIFHRRYEAHVVYATVAAVVVEAKDIAGGNFFLAGDMRRRGRGNSRGPVRNRDTDRLISHTA